MLDEVERLLCERYNVEAIDGPLKVALDDARSGGAVDPLRLLLAERELYRWREPIEAALADIADPLGPPVDEASEEIAPAASSEAQPDPPAEPHRRGRRRSE